MSVTSQAEQSWRWRHDTLRTPRQSGFTVDGSAASSLKEKWQWDNSKEKHKRLPRTATPGANGLLPTVSSSTPLRGFPLHTVSAAPAPLRTSSSSIARTASADHYSYNRETPWILEAKPAWPLQHTPTPTRSQPEHLDSTLPRSSPRCVTQYHANTLAHYITRPQYVRVSQQ